MTMTAMILSPSTLLLGVGSLAAYAWKRRKRPKTTTGGKAPSLPPPPASPFARDSGCTALADEAEIQRWVVQVVEPLVMPRVESYDVPRSEHEQARHAIEKIVDDVYAKAAPECAGYQTTATRKIWKALWCEVVVQLVTRGKIDEELDDVVALCMDPSFDPRAPRDSEGPTIKPPIPPLPFPPPPMDGSAPASMDGSAPAPLTNLGAASSRQELSQLGVMRLLEGTAGGAPILGRAARVVMLAFNPAWPGIVQARADMQRWAAEHPALAFVEVSFADTQRHFGKPTDVYGIAWALAAAAPDGRVYPTPIVRNDPRDPPPTDDQWAKVIAHASGFVGYGQVRTFVRPRRFGDVVRMLAKGARPAGAAARGTSKPTAARHRTPSARRPAGRRRR